MTEAEQIDKKPIVDEQGEEEKTHEIHGGRNLMILGLIAIIISVITTAASLIAYRVTGDIYLDRSRPGYISENETSDGNYKNNETISTDGEVTSETIDNYVQQLDSVRGRIDGLSESFAPDPLIDDALGIYPRDDLQE